MRVLDKTSIAVGLEWSLHESLSQAKRALGGKKKILVARKLISGECVQGVCEAPAKAGKLQAGALLVAAAANDALIYHPLGDGNAWICAIREGIPLHGYDQVTDEDTAKMTLAEVMSYVPTADIYGDIPGARGTLQDLLAPLSAKDKKAAQLGAPDSLLGPLLLVFAVLLLLAVLGGAYFFYKKYAAYSQLSEMQVRNEEEMRRLRAEFEAKVAQERAVFWHSRSPAAQFALWFDVLRQLPPSVEGWVPSAFNCDPAACQVSWKRDPRALPSASTRLPGEGADKSFNPNRTENNTRFPLPALAPVPHVSGPQDIDRYLLDLIPRLPTLTLTVLPVRNAITVAPPPNVPGLVAVTLGQEGGWTASTQNFAALSALLEKIDQAGVTLTALKIGNLGRAFASQTIQLEGRYRVGN